MGTVFFILWPVMNKDIACVNTCEGDFSYLFGLLAKASVKEWLCWLIFVNLTQLIVTFEVGISTEEMPRSDCPLGIFAGKGFWLLIDKEGSSPKREETFVSRYIWGVWQSFLSVIKGVSSKQCSSMVPSSRFPPWTQWWPVTWKCKPNKSLTPACS